MKPAIRIAAISHIPSIFVFTHDSVGLGEDGPTHQPIEHLAALRAIPNLILIRPADANEVSQAWRIAINRRNGPTVLALTRQNVPTFEHIKPPAVEKGAYILASFGKKTPDIILMASGSEVTLIYEAGRQLFERGYSVRVVSFPSWSLFEEQDETYKESVLPKKIRTRLAVEAGASLGWDRYVGLEGKTITIDHFGASAPYKIIFEKFGLTVENVFKQAKSQLPTVKRKNPNKSKKPSLRSSKKMLRRK
jgi:transketolase